MSEKTPKQFRFDKAIKKDGITETMRVYAENEKKPETTEQLPPLTDADLEGDFDFEISPSETSGTESADAPFDMHISVPPEQNLENETPAPKKINIEEIKFGPVKGEQTIKSVLEDTAKKRTIINKDALISLIKRLKKEEKK